MGIRLKFQRQDALCIFYREADELQVTNIKENLTKLIDALDNKEKGKEEVLDEIVEIITTNKQLVAICCATGLMEMLGRKIEKNEIVCIDIDLKEIKA